MKQIFSTFNSREKSDQLCNSISKQTLNTNHYSSGSCLEEFQILPFLQTYSDCGEDECLYASKSPADKSYWLSVDPDGHFSQPRMTDIEDIKNHIGRCHVCLGQRFTITRHSFKDTAPDCPKHFSVLWTGYSHLMVSFDYFSHAVLVHCSI